MGKQTKSQLDFSELSSLETARREEWDARQRVPTNVWQGGAATPPLSRRLRLPRHRNLWLNAFEIDEQANQIAMGLRRAVSGRDSAPGPDRQRTDDAGEAAAGKGGWPGLGHGRGHESARAELRPHVFHAQGRERAT